MAKHFSTLSREEFREALSNLQKGGLLDVDGYVIEHILEAPGINIILFDDSAIRTYFLANLVISVLNRLKTVIYIDLDTAFTAFFEDKGSMVKNSANLIVLTSDYSTIDDTVAEICSSKLIDLGLIIFDSITAFYHLSIQEIDFSNLNRKLGTYIALFKKASQNFKAPIVFTTMIRAKKVRGSASWTTTPAGGRLIQNASDVILKVDFEASKILVEVLKHRDHRLENRVVRFTIRLDPDLQIKV